jgi:phage FluMu gp28-like protein
MKLKLYKATPPQIRAKEITDIEKPYITMLAWGRQTGKTFFMTMDMIERAMRHNRGDVIMWVSPIMQQSTKVFLSIESMFADHPDVWDAIIKRYDRKNNFIEFYNGVLVKFQSADQGDNLRGGTVVFTYVDECAFMDYNLIEQILMPMHVRTGGRFLWGTTFNGKNWAWKKYQDGQKKKNKDFIVSYKATYHDLHDEEVTKFCEMVRGNVTKANFDQEYLCKPIAAGAIFTNIAEVVHKDYPKKDSYEQIYVGMDIGVNSDFAVLTAINERYEVICPQVRFNMKENDLTAEQYKQTIIDFYNDVDRDWIRKTETTDGKVREVNYGSRLVAANFEVNNKELLYDELFDAGLEKLYPIALTGSNKSDIVNNLVKLFEDKKIKIPDDEGLEEELGGFESKASPVTGKMTFGNNPKHAKHDDRVMSLAHAAWCAYCEMDGGTIEFM